MKRGRSIIFTAALALAVIVASSPVLAAPPPKGGQGPKGHLQIIEVWHDFENDILTITGEDFDFNDISSLQVSLGGGLDGDGPGDITLDCPSPTPTIIVCDVSSYDLFAGDYLLTVSNGTGQRQGDEYDLTIGAVGPIGPTGDTGAAGADGADGAEGPTGADGADGSPGAEGPTGSPGADGATGPVGATGPAGADGVGGGGVGALETTIVSNYSCPPTGDDITSCIVECPDGAGWMIAGGGGRCRLDDQLRDSTRYGPNGWRLVCTVDGNASYLSTGVAEVQAICFRMN